MFRILVILCSLFFAHVVLAEKAGAIKGEWKPTQITEDVFVIHGPIGTPNPENQGFMNNPAFIITSVGVVVVDPGGSVQTGEMLLKQIALVTDKPVVAVFDTHVHGDHWLGNQAIKAQYPGVKIYGHPNMIKEINEGAGEQWLVVAMRMTKGAVAGTRVVNASQAVSDGDEIKLGELTFKIHHHTKAHTDSDIMIEIPERKVMFLGDNCAVNRVIRNDHGSIKGNIEALDLAMKTGTQWFVPGHGPTSAHAAQLYRDFLAIIYNDVKVGFDDDLSDFEMKPNIAKKLVKWSDWDDFDRVLGKLINSAYLEIEAADFE